MWNNGEVEDEIHFLLNCNKYHDIRTNLFQKCSAKDQGFNTLMSDEKIQFIMNNMENSAAKFIKQAFNVRFKDICSICFLTLTFFLIKR